MRRKSSDGWKVECDIGKAKPSRYKGWEKARPRSKVFGKLRILEKRKPKAAASSSKVLASKKPVKAKAVVPKNLTVDEARLSFKSIGSPDWFVIFPFVLKEGCRSDHCQS